MTPSEFAAKWRGVTTGERASAQSHFGDLCRTYGWPAGLADDEILTQLLELNLEREQA